MAAWSMRWEGVGLRCCATTALRRRGGDPALPGLHRVAAEDHREASHRGDPMPRLRHSALRRSILVGIERRSEGRDDRDGEARLDRNLSEMLQELRVFCCRASRSLRLPARRPVPAGLRKDHSLQGEAKALLRHPPAHRWHRRAADRPHPLSHRLDLQAAPGKRHLVSRQQAADAGPAAWRRRHGSDHADHRRPFGNAATVVASAVAPRLSCCSGGRATSVALSQACAEPASLRSLPSSGCGAPAVRNWRPDADLDRGPPAA